jgi:hypothetical protein
LGVKVTLAALASCLALLLCFLPAAFGNNAGLMMPDYTPFGWTMRAAGGVLRALAMVLILSKPADLRVPSFAAWVGRGALAVAASCVL